MQIIKDNLKWILVVAVIAVTIFFVGRCSAPKPADVHLKKIDSLEQAVKIIEIEKSKAYKRAQVIENISREHEKDKQVYAEKFIAEQKKVAQLTRLQKEQLVKQRANVETLDSSFLTVDLSTSLLTMSNQLNHCRENASIDSLTILSQRDAYTVLDGAYSKAEKVIENKDATIKELKLIKTRPKWWTWPLVGAAAIGGFVLGAMK